MKSRSLNSVVFEDMPKIDTSKVKIRVRYTLPLFFDKGEIANQAVENVRSICGSDTQTANQE